MPTIKLCARGSLLPCTAAFCSVMCSSMELTLSPIKHAFAMAPSFTFYPMPHEAEPSSPPSLEHKQQTLKGRTQGRRGTCLLRQAAPCCLAGSPPQGTLHSQGDVTFTTDFQNSQTQGRILWQHACRKGMEKNFLSLVSRKNSQLSPLRHELSCLPLTCAWAGGTFSGRHLAAGEAGSFIHLLLLLLFPPSKNITSNCLTPCPSPSHTSLETYYRRTFCNSFEQPSEDWKKTKSLEKEKEKEKQQQKQGELLLYSQKDIADGWTCLASMNPILWQCAF